MNAASALFPLEFPCLAPQLMFVFCYFLCMIHVEHLSNPMIFGFLTTYFHSWVFHKRKVILKIMKACWVLYVNPSGVPFTKHGLTLIPAWIINHITSKVWHEITYPFPNFNGCTIEVWEWISNFIPPYDGCNYVSTMRLKLIHITEKGPWYRG